MRITNEQPVSERRSALRSRLQDILDGAAAVLLGLIAFLMILLLLVQEEKPCKMEKSTSSQVVRL